MSGDRPAGRRGSGAEATAEHGTRRGNRLKLVLQVGLTVILLTLILRKVTVGQILATLAAARPLPLVAGLLLGAVFLALKVVRWRWLLRRVGADATHGEALYSYLGGLAVGLVTPGRVGEIARSLYLKEGDRAYVSTLALVDKVLDLNVIVTVGAVGCWIEGSTVAGLALLAVAIGMASTPLVPRGLLDFGIRLVPVPALRRTAESISGAVTAVRWQTWIGGLAQAALAFGVALTQYYLFLSGLTAAASAAMVIFVLPLTVLSNLIPITVSGVGVREWVSVVLFSRYGVEPAIAVNVAVLLYLTNSLTPGLCGAFLAPRWRAARQATLPEVTT